MLSYSGVDSKVEFSYYRTTKGSIIHGVWEHNGEVALLKLMALAGIRHSENYSGVQILPWEAMG